MFIHPLGVVWPVWMWSPCLVAYIMVYPSTSLIQPLMDWQGCQYLYGWLELMVHHTPYKAEDESAPVFIHISVEHSLGCMTSMDVIPLFVCLCNGVSTSPMHPMMDWEWCQYLYQWLAIIVHHTASNVEDESAPVFIYPPMVYHLGVVWPVWMWSHCLVAYTMVDQPHISIYWWIDSGVNTYLGGWSSWYITHHPR